MEHLEIKAIFIVESSPREIAAGDFNADGIADLTTINAVDLSVLQGVGDGSFEAPSSLPLVAI